LTEELQFSMMEGELRFRDRRTSGLPENLGRCWYVEI